MALRHFLDIWQLEPEALRAILKDAKATKLARAGWPKGRLDKGAPLEGRTLAMVFEKSSTRTRFSFDMAMRQLGGSSITASSGDMQLGRGETVEDTAIVLSGYVDAIMIRAHHHADVEVFAEAASVPVINGLTDRSHPCQVMADLMTLEEYGLTLSETRIAWVGDGNNVCASYIHAAAKLGFSLGIGTPFRYAPDEEDIEMAISQGAEIDTYETAEEAVVGADVVVTDTFVSMGDKDGKSRLQDLEDYAVTVELMDMANPDAVFLHCLPAHRDEEVDAEVIDGPASLVFEAAENRLHVQKAILKYCLSE